MLGLEGVHVRMVTQELPCTAGREVGWWSLAGGNRVVLSKIKYVDILWLSISTPGDISCEKAHTGLYRGDIDIYRMLCWGVRGNFGVHHWGNG